MTHDELAVLTTLRTFPAGSRVKRKDLIAATRMPAERAEKALTGLDASGHVWIMGDTVRLGSDGTTFNT